MTGPQMNDTITRAEIEVLLGVSTAELSNILLQAKLQSPRQGGRWPHPQTIHSIVAHLRESKSAATDELRQARIDNTLADTRSKELRIAEQEGQLVDAGLALEVFASAVRQLTLLLERLPDTLERVGILTGSGVVRCREECDKTRAEIHAQLAKGFERESNEQPTEEVKRGRGRPKKND